LFGSADLSIPNAHSIIKYHLNHKRTVSLRKSVQALKPMNQLGNKDSSRVRLIGLPFLWLILVVFFSGFGFSSAGDDPYVWQEVEKIVAVGDIHGDYKNFVAILENTGLVDKDLHWTGGKIHLVQMGDVIDRGPQAKQCYDLLMRLQEEAEDAGGKVHMLLGNHEEINLTGIAFGQPGYVPFEQFYAFLSDKYRERYEKDIRKEYKKRGVENDGELDKAIRDLWEEIYNEPVKAASVYFQSINKTYGKWLLDQNVAIKINGIVFAHGGISERFSKWKLSDINKLAKRELRDFRDAQLYMKKPTIANPQIVYAPEGPFWFRGYALWEEETYQGDVDKILKNLEAEYMVVAHTPSKETIISKFGGRVWLIDTGISEYYGGNLSALVIEKGKFHPKEFTDEE